MLMNRRGLIRGLGALLAAPAIVRVASIMPVSVVPTDLEDLVRKIQWISPQTLIPVRYHPERVMQLYARALGADVLKNLRGSL